MDLHLPDDDGLSLCLRTRALPEPPRVVIYSAFADAALGVRAAIAGAYAVLAKTASPRALTAVLRGELRPGLDPRALRAIGERLEPPELAILGMLAHGVSEDGGRGDARAQRRERRSRRRAADAARGCRGADRSRPCSRPAKLGRHAHERPDPRGA